MRLIEPKQILKELINSEELMSKVAARTNPTTKTASTSASTVLDSADALVADLSHELAERERLTIAKIAAARNMCRTAVRLLANAG